MAFTDFSVPNDRPGACEKCRGSGRYGWGAVVNGQPAHEGRCNACRGSGRQSWADIHRNRAFNRHQMRRVCL